MKPPVEVWTEFEMAVHDGIPEEAAEVLYEDAARLAEAAGQSSLAALIRARLKTVRGW